MSAGDKRALTGCGLILFVCLAIVFAIVYAVRMSDGAQGEPCESSSDCRPGYSCADDVFRAVQAVCRKRCDSNADCESGACLDTLNDGPGLCR